MMVYPTSSISALLNLKKKKKKKLMMIDSDNHSNISVSYGW